MIIYRRDELYNVRDDRRFAIREEDDFYFVTYMYYRKE
jgi:hypothetical protein